MITIARSKAAHVALTLSRFADEFDALRPLVVALRREDERTRVTIERTAAMGGFRINWGPPTE